LLSKEFGRWILISNFIAWPLSYFAMNKWLQNFAFRTNQGILTFISAAFLALMIALVTVSYQSVKTALANRAGALRYEQIFSESFQTQCQPRQDRRVLNT
jgi:putative ABC transport system permease protein